MRLGVLNQRSERWMDSWPSTMARGPRRFVLAHGAPTFAITALVNLLVIGMWNDAPMTWSLALRTLLVGSVWMLPFSLWMAFVQWRELNRVYAERTGDASARALADRVVDVSDWVWMVAVVFTGGVVTGMAASMAWSSGAPALWAVALFCAIVGVVALRASVQTLRRTA